MAESRGLTILGASSIVSGLLAAGLALSSVPPRYGLVTLAMLAVLVTAWQMVRAWRA